MRGFPLHMVSRWLVAAGLPVLVAACQPTWQTRAPIVPAGGQADCGAAVTVMPGDTVYGIARRCGVSVRELIEANGLAAPYVVVSGQVLRLPGAGEYVVKKGDMLLVVARRLGVDFKTLARVNNKTAPYTIYVGEKLKVPGGHGGDTQMASRSDPGLVIASPNASAGGRAVPPYGARPAQAPPSPRPEDRHPAFDPQVPIPPAPAALAGKEFAWPVKGELLAEFGPLGKGQNNDGINIAAPRGTPVLAAENGVVAYVGNELKGFGNLLLVKHAGGWITAYAHNDQLLVKRGDPVSRGQRIATVGNSGGVDSPQLHFELRKGTEAVNPLEHLAHDA